MMLNPLKAQVSLECPLEKQVEQYPGNQLNPIIENKTLNST